MIITCRLWTDSNHSRISGVVMMEQLGQFMRQERLACGLTALEMSVRSGLSLQEIVDLEWNNAPDIDCFKLVLIARSLELPAASLMDTVETMSSPDGL